MEKSSLVSNEFPDFYPLWCFRFAKKYISILFSEKTVFLGWTDHVAQLVICKLILYDGVKFAHI